MNSALSNLTQVGLLQPVPQQPTSVPLRRYLPEAVSTLRSAGMSYAEAIRHFQERYIVNLLVKHRGHMGKTAEELRMHRNTLSRTLKCLNLDVAAIRQDIRRSIVAERRRGQKVVIVDEFNAEVR